MQLKRRLANFALLSAVPFVALPVLAQTTWPNKPLKMLVGFPPGSSPDLMARALSEPLSKALGQAVVVENRPGASGNIAAEQAVKATDDHTMLLATGATLTTAKLLYKKITFDPADLTPLSLIGSSPLVLVAQSKLVSGSSSEFLRTSLIQSDKWNYGSPGNGLTGHLGMELIKMKTGLKPQHVPFPGTPQIFTAMGAGDIHMALAPLGPAQAQVRSGRVKAIGITTTGRSVLAPEIPPLTDAGVLGVHLEVWNAMAVPKSMNKTAQAKLLAALQQVTRSDEVRQKLFAQGWQAQGTSPEHLRNVIKADSESLGAVIKAGNIQLD